MKKGGKLSETDGEGKEKYYKCRTEDAVNEKQIYKYEVCIYYLKVCIYLYFC